MRMIHSFIHSFIRSSFVLHSFIRSFVSVIILIHARQQAQADPFENGWRAHYSTLNKRLSSSVCVMMSACFYFLWYLYVPVQTYLLSTTYKYSTTCNFINSTFNIQFNNPHSKKTSIQFKSIQFNSSITHMRALLFQARAPSTIWISTSFFPRSARPFVLRWHWRIKHASNMQCHKIYSILLYFILFFNTVVQYYCDMMMMSSWNAKWGRRRKHTVL